MFLPTITTPDANIDKNDILNKLIVVRKSRKTDQIVQNYVKKKIEVFYINLVD